MFGTTKSTGFALGVALLLSQSVAFADEVSSTTVKTESPLGSAASKVEVKADANGAKIEEQKSGVRANADGSVSVDSKKETREFGLDGSAHKKSSSSTTFNADGTASTVKQEKECVKP